MNDASRSKGIVSSLLFGFLFEVAMFSAYVFNVKMYDAHSDYPIVKFLGLILFAFFLALYFGITRVLCQKISTASQIMIGAATVVIGVLIQVGMMVLVVDAEFMPRLLSWWVFAVILIVLFYAESKFLNKVKTDEGVRVEEMIFVAVELIVVAVPLIELIKLFI